MAHSVYAANAGISMHSDAEMALLEQRADGGQTRRPGSV
jgi:hypothetical protein